MGDKTSQEIFLGSHNDVVRIVVGDGGSITVDEPETAVMQPPINPPVQDSTVAILNPASPNSPTTIVASATSSSSNIHFP